MTVGAGSAIAIVWGFLWYAMAANRPESDLGFYFFVLWPGVCALSGALTGLLLPASGGHPILESGACNPVIWVLLLSVSTERAEVDPVAFVVLILLGWAGTFAGLTVCNLASGGAGGSKAERPARIGGDE